MGRVEEFKFPEGKIHYRAENQTTARRGEKRMASYFQKARCGGEENFG
jgi:hypothetical protein